MIKKISYFIKVAQCGNITKAANELFISQPSLSVAIKQLEKDWNVTLFERGCNSLSLSADGRRLLPYAESVMYDYQPAPTGAFKKDQRKFNYSRKWHDPCFRYSRRL